MWRTSLEKKSHPEPRLIAPKSFDFKPGSKIAIIIDLENLPKFPREIEDLVSIEGLSFFSICGRHYHSSETFDVKGVRQILSPSIGPNASDICMMTFIGFCLSTEAYSEYLLVSRDKFVAPLVEIISKGTEPKTWVPKPAEIISTKGQLLERLKELGMI